MKKNLLLLAAALISFLLPAIVFANATITIVNLDGPGEGFNDPTPAAPVGGNPGTTLGQQRLNVFAFAASIWAAKLDSNVEIRVRAAFNPLAAGVLGSAGTVTFIRDFPGPFGNYPGSEFPATWYFIALANKRVGFDITPDPSPAGADINAQFNSNFVFYLGFDNNEGTLVDLLPVVLHEIGHGLNFANAVNEATGANLLGFTDIYSHYTFDDEVNLHWNVMTDAQRAASAINIFNVVWDGPNVTAAVPDVLGFGLPQLVVNSPASIASNYALGPAAFGAPLSSPGVTGNVVLGLDPADAAGPSTTDACSPLTNAGAIAGNIALVDRGTCGFIVKVKNAQNAGAIAVIVADNVAGSPPAGLGGADPTITIPSGRITLADGNIIKAELGVGVNATLGINPTARAGWSDDGFVRLATFDPVLLGSSISHYDGTCSPNQLMEPAINPDLDNNVEPPDDLTLPLFRDIGWYPDEDVDGVADDGDQCLGSIQDATVIIEGCDSGVPNPVFASGCSITDLVLDCADGAANHGQFMACVDRTLNGLKKQGIITGPQKEAISACADASGLP